MIYFDFGSIRTSVFFYFTMIATPSFEQKSYYQKKNVRNHFFGFFEICKKFAKKKSKFLKKIVQVSHLRIIHFINDKSIHQLTTLKTGINKFSFLSVPSDFKNLFPKSKKKIHYKSMKFLCNGKFFF